MFTAALIILGIAALFCAIAMTAMMVLSGRISADEDAEAFENSARHYERHHGNFGHE